MLIKSRDFLINRTAWINYRERLRETLSLLDESLTDADDTEARVSITRQIQRHNTYLRRADERIIELSK